MRKKAKHYNNVVWTGTYVMGTYLQREKKAKHYNNVVWMGTYVVGTYLQREKNQNIITM